MLARGSQDLAVTGDELLSPDIALAIARVPQYR